MAKKTLQRHCAEFILNHCSGELYKQYRRDCLQLWKCRYGENFASEVEAIIRKEWKDESRSRKAV